MYLSLCGQKLTKGPSLRNFLNLGRSLPKFLEEFRVIIEVYDPRLLIHMLVGPGEAKKWIQKAEWGNPKNDISGFLIFNMVPLWIRKSLKNSNPSLKSHS